jgi:hypothetical protein
MPHGKAAGQRCVNLDPATHRCRIWNTAAYPEVCRRFLAAPDTCGETRDEALRLLDLLELETRTSLSPPRQY